MEDRYQIDAKKWLLPNNGVFVLRLTIKNFLIIGAAYLTLFRNLIGFKQLIVSNFYRNVFLIKQQI